MKSLLLALILLLIPAIPQVFAQTGEEPTVYVIQKGDTLWDLSERFFRDPNFWPNLWAKNPVITNPHFIFPGQKVRFFADRVEIEPAPAATPGPPPVASIQPRPAATAKSPTEEPARERTFVVTGSEGFLLEKELKPSGIIISNAQGRQIVGEDDIVYTDIGKDQGARIGDRYSVFVKTGSVSHPITNVILGERVIPLGTIQLSEVEQQASRAIVTKSFQEISPGSYLLPFHDKHREVTLRAADRDLNGYIVETRDGKTAVSAGELVYLDLGRKQGAQVGNMLYIVREILPDTKYVTGQIKKLPVDVLGALVIVDVAESTSTALIVKSIDTIYQGERVEIRAEH
jgi:hypothetical protein